MSVRFPCVAKEDEILRGGERVDGSLVRVECLHHTRAILRKAGFLDPVPFRRYLVPVETIAGVMRVKRKKCRVIGEQ